MSNLEYAWIIKRENECIYRVPAWLKDDDGNDKRLYVPEVISFGPYHWGDPLLADMEAEKKRFFDITMTRCNKSEEEFKVAMRTIETEVRSCYQGTLRTELDRDKFVEMLVLDGCFMLEYLHLFTVGVDRDEINLSDDPLFKNAAKLDAIQRDIIKMENQLPFRVLQELLSVQYTPGTNDDIKLVLGLLNPTLVCNGYRDEQFRTVINAVAAYSSNTKLHCLDIFRSSLLFDPNQAENPERPVTNPPAHQNELMLNSVGELIEAGVKLRRRTSQTLWDIKFNKHRGTLAIPPIKIDNVTQIVFLNLIAYEQSHYGRDQDKHIAAYAAFMDSLADTTADVRYLKQAEIIVHTLGSDAAVADLFNGLVKGDFDWKKGRLSSTYREVNKYCTKKRHRWRATLVQDYLRNPWVIISLFAAVFLFGLTITQTVYTIMAYEKPPKP